MKFRNTLVIALLFLAMVGYLYFVEGPSHEQEAQAKKLLSLKADDVSALTLAYPDKEIVLKKTAAGWHMQKPLDVNADQTAVTNMVSALTDAELKRTIEGKAEKLDVYGLDKPEAVVTVGLTNGKTLPALKLGKTAPIGFSAYAQIEGETEVKIVPSVFQSGMKRDVKDLRDKTIIDFKDEEVQGIEIQSAKGETELARDGDGWKIVKPEAHKADPTEVRALLAAIKGVRADDFVDQPTALADYGLDKPRGTIAVVVGADKTRKEILVGPEKAQGSKNVLYVKRSDGDTVYEAGTWIWAGLDKNSAALRDKMVLGFDLASLGTIEVTRREGDPYKIVKDKSTPPPAKTKADADAEAALEGPHWKIDGAKGSRTLPVGELVADLHGLKGYEIAAEKPASLMAYGLTDPEITFSLIDDAGKPIGRILVGQIGSDKDANVYAMAEGSDVVLHLRSYLFTHLNKKKDELVDLAPAPSASPAKK